jgi:CDP-diacylglycerol--glycerol-3-phosphate 3-phosphatidyltransferase
MMQQAGLTSYALKDWYYNLVRPVVVFCVRLGARPNVLTIVGLVGSGLAGYFFHLGWIFLAGITIWIAGTFDIIDGQVARESGQTTRYGALFDSTMDRYAEFLIFCGLASYFRHSFMLYVVIAALAGSILVSYSRARGEGLGVSCGIGLMQRPERFSLLTTGAVASAITVFILEPSNSAPVHYILAVTVIVIAVMANVTVVQRLLYLKGELSEAK